MIAEAQSADPLLSGKPAGIGRDKFWQELSIEEKTERTRQVVKMLQFEVQRLANLVNKMKEHRHNENGEAIVEQKLAHTYGGEALTVSKIPTNPEESYF